MDDDPKLHLGQGNQRAKRYYRKHRYRDICAIRSELKKGSEYNEKSAHVLVKCGNIYMWKLTQQNQSDTLTSTEESGQRFLEH